MLILLFSVRLGWLPASGFVPIAAANETYKLGVNYVIYALTH